MKEKVRLTNSKVVEVEEGDILTFTDTDGERKSGPVRFSKQKNRLYFWNSNFEIHDYPIESAHRKIKVPADKSKTSYIRVRLPAWKKAILKKIADARGTTMTNLFEEWLDQLIAGEGIEIEIEILELKKNKP